jgi:hypothetical protein
VAPLDSQREDGKGVLAMPGGRKGDYSITLEFERGMADPSGVFRAMSEVIDTLRDLDRQLVQSVNLDLEPKLVLEDVEAGSVKAWLRSTLWSMDDEALAKLDWKVIVGRFLVKAKYRILKHIEDRDEIANRDQVKQLEGELLALAEETELTMLPVYAPVPPQQLLGTLSRLSNALSPLSARERMVYESEEGDAVLNQRFHVSPERIEDLLTRETLVSESELILGVKKPDYLGRSMWEFRFEQRTVEAKLRDEEWLHRFQAREVDVRPGDSLRAIVSVSVKYGFDGSVVATHYDIVRVLGVLPQEAWHQDTIFGH